MFKSNFVRNVAEPLLARVGTFVAAALVGYGMAATDQATVAQAITIVGGVGFDLVVRKWLGR